MGASTIQLAKPAALAQNTATIAQMFALLSDQTRPVTVSAPGKLTLEGKRFTVRASGKATSAGATTTALVSLYAANAIPVATPLNPANWKLLGASTARVVNTATAAWWIEAALIADSISGLLQGSFSAMLNNTLDASAPVANQLTGINGTNLNVSQPGPVVVPPQDPFAFFAVSVTFGVNASAQNIGTLGSFTVEF